MNKFVGVIYVFIALMAASYRMDEQFFPSEKVILKSYVKLKKAKVMFFFKNKNQRYRFLLAAVIQQYIAYAYLLLNVILAILEKFEISGLNVYTINMIYIGFDLAFVLITGIFYKVYK